MIIHKKLIKRSLLYLMIVFYVVAGINHFIHPSAYLKIMPPYLPKPLLLINISGAAEIVLALLLLPPATRGVAAWLIILLLIAVFPANIQMTVNYWHQHNPKLWVVIIRLPLQLVLIWWAWSYTK